MKLHALTRADHTVSYTYIMIYTFLN